VSLNSTQSLEVSVDSYATFSAILAHIPHVTLDNAYTRPSRMQACAIARDRFQELNSLLSVMGFVIPIASGNSTGLAYVRRMSAVGVASSIEAAAASVDGRSSDTADFLQKEYSRMWTALKNGDVTLPGAARTGNPTRHDGERKPAASFSPVNGVEREPTFTMDTQW